VEGREQRCLPAISAKHLHIAALTLHELQVERIVQKPMHQFVMTMVEMQNSFQIQLDQSALHTH
jgi:hypothetical protein